MPTDSFYMLRALELARKGLGRVEPNPPVGCVLVRGGKIVGEGWHKKFGGPHAEIEALKKAGARARGATAYVTLEPCCHHGKTPPCTDALIRAGITRVKIGCPDPYSKVAGRGLQALRRAGLAVTTGLEARAARRLIAPFAKRVTRHLPWVIAKWAQTLDGAIATESGDSRWISGEQSRRQVHELRGRVDAIIVGIATVLADDPQLTARTARPRRIARRVVMDPQLKIPLTSRLVRSAKKVPLLIATGPQPGPKARRLQKAGAEILEVPQRRSGALNLKFLLRHLALAHAATHVLVEGGGRTLGEFLQQKCLDEAWCFLAPRLLGDGRGRRSFAGGLPVTAIHAAHRLKPESIQTLGDDYLLRYLF